MNLSKLFEMQRKLDGHIEQEHPRQPGEDRLAKKILALYSELGELLNEWRGFKFWSKDQEPRTQHSRGVTGVFGAPAIEYYNPLLEEYVDCLHFILSIGNEMNMNELYEDYSPPSRECESVLEQFVSINYDIGLLYYERDNEDLNSDLYNHIFGYFIGLGEMLGFSWEQIGEAYTKKNAENHARQANGY